MVNRRRPTAGGGVTCKLTVKPAFFYADDRLVDSTDPGFLQSAFDILTGIFDWVGMWTNIRKTVGVV